MRSSAVLCSLLTAGLFLATPRDVRACGGCFHEPTPPMETGTVVTDHQMIFVVSQQETTLYDMIQYSGAPSSFAWVLPIHGTVKIGLSSDTVFAALDQLTKPVIYPPPLPACPVPANCGGCDFGASAGGASSSGSSSGGAPPQVTVLTQAVVGPYATVQLQSTDPAALTSWLTTNGYVIPSNVQSIIAAYVTEGFNFLAMRLAPGQGVQAMRPVSVTSAGAGLSLPLRMVAAGTGPIVGITLWVVSDGRYEPQNFPSFTIAPSEIIWDWATSNSNYTTLRQTQEALNGNAAWQIESSLDLSPYSIETLVLGSGCGGIGSSGSTVPCIPATQEGYTNGSAADGGAAGDAGGAMSAEAQRQADLTTLFPASQTGAYRITRMRGDLAQAALANDLVLQAPMNQAVLSNQYQTTLSVNAPACPNPPVCPCGGLPGGGGTSSGSSGGGIFGSSGVFGGGSSSSSTVSSSSSGSTGSSGGGVFGSPPTGGTGSSSSCSSGCAAAPAANRAGAFGLLIVGLGAVLFRARRRRHDDRPRA